MDSLYFVTATGKKITFEKSISWSVLRHFDRITSDIIKQFNLSKDKFNFLAPSVGEVDDAISNQLPAFLVENYHALSWFSVKGRYFSSKNKWSSSCNHLDITIPNSCWNSLIETKDSATRENYMAYFSQIMNSNPYNETLFMASYKFWMVFIKIESDSIKYAVLSRSQSYYEQQNKGTTFGQPIRYQSIFAKGKESLCPARASLKRNWINSANIDFV